MNKNKILEIIKFSFASYFKSKGFIIFNIITLLSIVIGINWSAITKIFNIDFDNDYYKLEIVTNNDYYYNTLENALKDNERLVVSRSTENNYTADTIEKNILVLEMEENQNQGVTASLTSLDSIPTYIYNYIKDELDAIKKEYVQKEYSLTDEDLEYIESDVNIERIMLGVDTSNMEEKELLKFMAGFLSYMAITMLFSKIANEIAQEKQSKSSEYVLSTVSSKNYLFAKVAGNILFAIFQLVLFLAYILLALSILSLLSVNVLESTNVLEQVTSTSSEAKLFSTISFQDDILPFASVLIILNLLSITLLSIIQATLASKVNSIAEAGNTMSILLALTITCYFASNLAINSYSTVSLPLHILSVLPVFSAYFIPNIMIIGQASIIEIVVAIILSIVAIPIAFRLCHEKFKNGILDYSKRVEKEKKELSKEEKEELFLNKRTFSNLGMAVGLAILTYISLTLVCSYILPPITGAFLSETYASLITQILSQVLGLGISYLVVKQFNENKEKVLPCKKSVSNLSIVLMVFALCYSINYFVSTIIYPKLGLDYNVVGIFTTSASSPLLEKLLFVIMLAVIPGIFEELFFRKGLIDLLERHGTTFAIVFSATVFGFIHMNVPQGIFAFLIGLVLGYVYVKTKNIKISMLVHALNNGISAIAMVLLPANYEEPANVLNNPKPYLVFVALLITTFVVGILLLIKYAITHKSLKKILNYKPNINLKTSFGRKYKYLFCDYIFDLTIVLLIVLTAVMDMSLKIMLLK